MHLLESVLLGSLGTDAYNALWTANADWSNANVTKALENFKTILSYAGSPQDDWQPAAKQVADGEAAFNIMGDWAYGYFHNPPEGGLGKESHKDFDWAASPGTDGTFMWLSDSFTLPKGAPNRDGAIAWLKVAASKEGQDAFNPLKGSIPARKDADQSLYKDYLSWDLEQWANDKLAKLDPARRGRQRPVAAGHHRRGRPVPAGQRRRQVPAGAGRGGQEQRPVS